MHLHCLFDDLVGRGRSRQPHFGNRKNPRFSFRLQAGALQVIQRRLGAIRTVITDQDFHSFAHTAPSRTVLITSSNNTPLVEIALPPVIVRAPLQSVKVPPASSMIGCSAAQSHTFITGSIITSALPVATSRWP